MSAPGAKLKQRVKADFKGRHYEAALIVQDWRFADNVVPRVTSRLSFANGDAVWEAAIAGLGVAVLPTFIAYDAVKRGAHSILLARHMRPPIAMYALHPSMCNQSARAFIDFLFDTFGVEPY